MSIYKTLLLAIVVIFPWTIPAEAQKEDTVKDEMKKLQGVWQLTKWLESDGSAAPAEEIKDVTFEFKENEVIKSDRKSDGRVKYVLDTKKNPKWFDFEFENNMVMKGIYIFKGDELTICVDSGDGKERPTEFKSKTKNHVTFVMKKTKK